MIMALVLLSACGRPGPSGIAGPAGHDGTNGSNGTDGINGTNGTSCGVSDVPANAAAPNGGSLITCGNTQSLVLNGTNGLNGSNGTDGTNGTSGTVVAPIQFCSGSGSYPSTFPEVGFCIGGNIYAVYSANGGFLTEVLPGTWSSDGINSSCTFTVGPDCKVTR
jgi:hypothetical protein